MNIRIMSFVFLLFLTSTLVQGSIVLTPGCNAQGGVCVKYGECPPDKLASVPPMGQTCPIGRQCCNGVPASDRSCHDHGGECRSKEACGQAPVANEGQCPRRQVCCIDLTHEEGSG